MKVVFTIDRLEGELAVLKDDLGNSVIWPRTKLPEEFKEGQSIVFDISTDEINEKNDRNTAKDILNEILDIN